MNRDGRVQRFTQAKAPPGMARPAWWIAAEAWSHREPGRLVPETAALAFAGLGTTIPALAGITYADLGVTGRVVSRNSAARAGSPAGAGSR
jgi:predicted molibdopterin-dependent oxidoreductase YjgC